MVDEKLLAEILTDIASALLTSDVNIKYVAKLRDSIKTQVVLLLNTDGGGANMRRLI